MTVKQKLWILKTGLKLYMKYGNSLSKRMLHLYDKVEDWAEAWKADGFQPLSDEKARRWLRLGKAFGLAAVPGDLKEMQEDSWLMRNLKAASAWPTPPNVSKKRRGGKTHGR